MEDKEKLQSKTDQELARIQAINHPLDEASILTEKEWQRRLMKEQYKLNIKVALISACCSGIFGLIGVIVGNLLK